MPNEKKESGVVGQIAVGILVALIAGGTSPWWWDKFFGSSSQSTQPSQTTSPATPTTPPSNVPKPSPALPSPVVPPASQALCQYKKIEPISVEIRPERSVYTNLEIIKVVFTIDGTPEGSKQWITVVEASKPETAYGEWQWIGKNGSVSFKSQPPGDYKIRLFINTGSGDVPVGDCSITVKPIQ